METANDPLQDLPAFDGEKPEFFDHNQDSENLPEDGLTFVAEEPTEDVEMPADGEEDDHDHDHDDHDHDHNHEDGTADHSHGEGEDSDHTHGEDGSITWHGDHAPSDNMESKIGEMDPDNIITVVPPPGADDTNSFNPERGWEPEAVTNSEIAESREGEPAMDNMIVRPGDGEMEAESAAETEVSELDEDPAEAEAELEDFLNEEMGEIAETEGGDSEPVDGEMEDIIEEATEEFEAVGNDADEDGGDEDSDEDGDADMDESGDEDGDESADSDESADGDEEDGDEEDGDESADGDGDEEDSDEEDGDESADGDDSDDEDGDGSPSDVVDEEITSQTQVPTDLDSIEKEMEEENFIQKSVENWHHHNATNASGEDVSAPVVAPVAPPVGDVTVEEESSDEDGSDDEEDGDDEADEADEEDEDSDSADGDGESDSDSDEGDEEEPAENETPTEETEGGDTGKSKGPEGKKDGIENLLDDDETKNALFGTPTLAPSTKMIWNDAAPVFKPELTEGDCSLDSIKSMSSISDIPIEACLQNKVVLGGVGGILFILLCCLCCICRKCCCRSSKADARGQYRQVANQYSDMKYDNTFSDEYSTGSGGDIELSLAEVNG